MSDYYNPKPAGPLFALANLDAAYDLAGVKIPARGEAVAEVLALEPGVDQVMLQATRDSLTAEDPTQWLEDTITRMIRATAVDALREAYARDLTPIIESQLPVMQARATADLAPAFAREVKALTKAAAQLPEGDNALDLDAVVATDATKALKAAQAALSALAVYGAIFEPPRGLTRPRAASLLTVVDVAEVEPEQSEGVFGQVGIQDEQSRVRSGIRRFRDTADRLSLDRTLVGVARGEFAGVELKLAASAEEAQARAVRVETAHRRVPVLQARRKASFL